MMQVRDRVVELRRVRAGDLLPNPKNWRRHPPQQQNALRAMLADVGYADALLARETAAGLMLVDGHLRAETTPDSLVPVLVLDVDEVEADKLLATLDPLAGMAVADEEALSELMASVSIPSEDLLRELERLSGQDGPPQGLTDPDAVPAVPEEPVTKPGDLWVLGKHRVLCGDATDANALAHLMAGERAGLMWTDPPYGVDYVGKTERALTITNDGSSGLPRLLTDAFAAAGAMLAPGAAIYVAHPAGAGSVTFGMCFVAAGWRLHETLVWVKNRLVLGHSDYHYRHEPLLYGYKPGGGRRGRGGAGWYGDNRQDSVLEVDRPAASREHPTAKPVELVARCVANSSPPGGLVLDPFMGSGSTLIACEEFGRKGRGMEIDPRYCDVVVRRWEDFTGGKAVLG